MNEYQEKRRVHTQSSSGRRARQSSGRVREEYRRTSRTSQEGRPHIQENTYPSQRRNPSGTRRSPAGSTNEHRYSSAAGGTGTRERRRPSSSNRTPYANPSSQPRTRSGRKPEDWEILERENEREYREYLKRKKKREERKRREEEQRRRQRAMVVRSGGAALLAVLLIFVVYRIFFSNPVMKTVTVEAGTKEFQESSFLKRDVEAEFVTDTSEIDTSHVGEQKVVIDAGGKERTSTLIVQDTKAPKAEPESAMIDIDGDLSPEELVTNIEDATDVSCSFKEEPDLSKEATVPVTVILTDEGGNTAEVDSEVEVIEDTEPPVIDGVAPLEGFVGDPVSYKSEITVTDNCDKEVKLEVDNSDVDTETPGTYDVYYSATDRAGNTAEAETTITMKEKPEDYVEPEEVYAEADEVLDEITTEDMTLKEKARAIYDWCRGNIGYTSTSEKDSWTNGAYQGFTQHQGDCFIFFATAKALLTEAEIPNIDVVKSDTSHSRHYWSLIDCGDGWYHFDTTPRSGGGEFFMLTDEEILSYSASHNNSHIFDQSLYPATPTEDSEIE